MIKAISELKKTHEEMGMVLNDLAVLEDGDGADWSQVVIDYKWIANECNHRLTTLKQRNKNATSKD